MQYLSLLEQKPKPDRRLCSREPRADGSDGSEGSERCWKHAVAELKPALSCELKRDTLRCGRQEAGEEEGEAEEAGRLERSAASTP